MKLTLKKELPVIAIVALPFIYLMYIWNDLPDIVPLHWNAKGDADGYGSKSNLWLMPFLLPFLVYVVFLIVPLIDPKGKIKNMGKKYNRLKIVFTLFMSALALVTIYSAKNQNADATTYIFIITGLLIAVLGNFMKTIKSNYFIGIRTPWTLENEEVWKSTHELGGRMWVIGGLAMIMLTLVLDSEINAIVFTVISLIISFVPIAHSYFKFKKLKQ